MSYEGLGSLVAEIRQASENITGGDARMNQRLDGIERSANELYLKQGRPGTAWETKDDDIAERKDAAAVGWEFLDSSGAVTVDGHRLADSTVACRDPSVGRCW